MKRDFRRRVNDSVETDFLLDCDVIITDSNTENNAYTRSPIVPDYFPEGERMSFSEFIQNCKDFAETTNGYFDIVCGSAEGGGDTLYVQFYTSDNLSDEGDEDYYRSMEGTKIGYADFSVAINPTQEIASMIEEFI